MTLLEFPHTRVSFEPEQLHAMSKAFDAVCHELRLSRKTDRATEFVAQTIVDLAMTGETNHERLTARALAAFHDDQRNT
jgi:hypothetical protein